MDTLHFNLPTEVFAGSGCVRAQARAWCLGQRALLVTGKHGAAASGALEDVRAVLDLLKIPYSHFDGISENPSEDQVYAGAEMAQAAGCDFVVAIGGGSPLDAAKSIAWVVASKIARKDFYGKPLPEDPVLPIVAIPLTCGTGSEVTPYSIITNHAEKTKVNLSSPKFFPKVALLDPRYLESLPPQVLCDTMLDALSHAIESIYAPKSNALSEAISLEAIRTLMPELVRMAHGTFVNLPRLQYAAMLAGMAIAQTGTGLVHAMGYPLTYHCHIPHGRANGILLAGYLDFMTRGCAALTERILEAADLDAPEALQAIVDMLLERLDCNREAPAEDDLVRFTREPLRLECVRRYRTMPSPEEVMDIYRTGF